MTITLVEVNRGLGLISPFVAHLCTILQIPTWLIVDNRFASYGMAQWSFCSVLKLVNCDTFTFCLVEVVGDDTDCCVCVFLYSNHNATVTSCFSWLTRSLLRVLSFSEHSKLYMVSASDCSSLYSKIQSGWLFSYRQLFSQLFIIFNNKLS